MRPGGPVVLLGGQALTCDLFHYIAETIQLAQRRIDVWRNANALKLFMNDRRREDAVLIE